MQNKIEVIVISIIAFLCILISVLDFVGALESIPWISQRISIMTLLATGMIAIYLVTQHNRKFKRIEDIIAKGNKQILDKIVIDETNQKILDAINGIWNEREDEFEIFFQKVMEIPASEENKELVEFLKNTENEFDQGNIFGTKYSYPWDINIIAINMKGVRIYHKVERAIGRKYQLGHPTWEIIKKKKNGTMLWINRDRGKLNLIENFPIYSNLRFTKLHFREIIHLEVIVIIQSHINIIPHLKRIEI